MSTATKLSYLNETKSQLKDMINYGLPTEQQITSSTTFRNYVSSIFNAFLEALRTPDTLFTNLPKKSGTGANITLNDTANAPMRIELGASELTQDGTPTPSSPQDIHTIGGSNTIKVEGNNLFNTLNFGYSDTNVSVNAIDNNNIVITYNATNATYLKTRYIIYNLKQNTNYTFKATITNSNSNVTRNWLLIKDGENSSTLYNNRYISGGSATFNTGSNTSIYVCMYVVGEDSVSSNTATWNNIQLNEGTTALPYEPYTSQEADIDLKSKNLLPISTLSTTATNGITFINNGDGSYTFNGTASAYTTFNLFNNLSFNGNYTYVLKDSATSGFNLYLQDSNGTGLYTINTYRTANTNVGKMLIGINSGTTLNGLVIKPYVYSGDYDSTMKYEPYYNYGEYCKIGNYEDKFIRTSGKNLFDGTLTPENYSYNSSGVKTTDTDTCINQEINNIDYSSIYVSFSSIVGTAYVRVCEYNSSGTFIKRTLVNTNQSLTLDNNTKKLIFSVNASSTKYFTNLMINKGTTALDYEPYGSNEWYIKKNIPQQVVATSDITIRTSYTNINYAQVNKKSDAINYGAWGHSKVYCNKATWLNEPSNYDTTDNIGKIITGSSQNQYWIGFDKTATLETMQTQLDGAIIDYIAKTPTYTQITGTLAEQLENVYKKMLSYSGTTNISQVNNDLSFNLSVQAIEEL